MLAKIRSAQYRLMTSQDPQQAVIAIHLFLSKFYRATTKEHTGQLAYTGGVTQQKFLVGNDGPYAAAPPIGQRKRHVAYKWSLQ